MAEHIFEGVKPLQLVRVMVRVFCALLPIDSFTNDNRRSAMTEPKLGPSYGLKSGFIITHVRP